MRLVDKSLIILNKKSIYKYITINAHIKINAFLKSDPVPDDPDASVLVRPAASDQLLVQVHHAHVRHRSHVLVRLQSFELLRTVAFAFENNNFLIRLQYILSTITYIRAYKLTENISHCTFDLKLFLLLTFHILNIFK